jgi:hypothetical protein
LQAIIDAKNGLYGDLGWASLWKQGKRRMVLIGQQWIGDGVFCPNTLFNPVPGAQAKAVVFIVFTQPSFLEEIRIWHQFDAAVTAYRSC